MFHELHGISRDAERAEDDARRIRKALAPHYDGVNWLNGEHIVRMDCFNEAEVRDIERRLTPEERLRVRFTWRTWPERKS